jgi:hypothetical protein
MLDTGTEWWFGALQSIGALAATGALIFVGVQTHLTTKQVKSSENEATIRLRPWIYRILHEDRVFGLDQRHVRMFIKNTGKLAANRIYLHYLFKRNRTDETGSNRDVEDQLLNEEPIVHERLLLPNEVMYLHMVMDDYVFLDRYNGRAIFIYILVRYMFAGGDDEREGRYVGIFKIQSKTEVVKQKSKKNGRNRFSIDSR